MAPSIVRQLEANLLKFYGQMMKTFTPSFAKIFSTPALALFLFFFFVNGDEFISGGTFEGNLMLFLVISVLIAYLISCLVWTYGKNHRRILIVIFTLLTSIISFFFFNLLDGFFSVSLTNLGLPCGGAYGQCPPPLQSPQSQISIILSYLSIGIPILSLIIGILSFINEVRKSSDKSKKQA